MCKAFSCIVLSDAKVLWKFGVDSHSDLVEMNGLRDDTADPKQMQFAKIEITPKDSNYLTATKPEDWEYRVDESPDPVWLAERHQAAAWKAHAQWFRKLDRILVRKPIVHPFEKSPPKTITDRHKKLLEQWASVVASVGDSVWASVWASVRASVWDSVWDSVRDSVWDSVRDSVWDSVVTSVGDSVWASVWASVRASVRYSVWDSVWDSVRDSVWAYIGSFFRIPKWKGIKHSRGVYPYQPLVDLWNVGLVPSFDGKTWRLHGGKDAQVLYEWIPGTK